MKIEDLRDVNEEKVEYGDVLEIKGVYYLVIKDARHKNVRLIDLNSNMTEYTFDNLDEVNRIYKDQDHKIIKSYQLKLVIE